MDTRVRKLLNDKGYNEKDVPNHASGTCVRPDLISIRTCVATSNCSAVSVGPASLHSIRRFPFSISCCAGAAWAPSDAENAAKEVLTEFSVEFGEQVLLLPLVFPRDSHWVAACLAHQAGCWLTAVLQSLPSASAPRGLLTCFLCVPVLRVRGQLTARWWALFEHILTKFRDGMPRSSRPVSPVAASMHSV